MSEIIYRDESFKIVGICMEIHRILGGGFLEAVYKDAIEYEFRKNKIPFLREKQYEIGYKDTILSHKYYADFVVYGDIILEVKAVNIMTQEFIKQTLNYLAVSKCKLGLVVNFGRDKLEYKRVII